uniref:hypothetical protein n=1 Tax=Endozoicomonas sp. ONNA2 TaxID=2828741 RepID=UPI002148552B
HKWFQLFGKRARVASVEISKLFQDGSLMKYPGWGAEVLESFLVIPVLRDRNISKQWELFLGN